MNTAERQDERERRRAAVKPNAGRPAAAVVAPSMASAGSAGSGASTASGSSTHPGPSFRHGPSAQNGLPSNAGSSQHHTTMRHTNSQFNSHPSPSEFVIPALQNAERLNDADVAVLRSVVKIMSACRGAAVIATADYLIARKQSPNYLQAVLLAAELLEHEPEAVCETLATLLTDGWDAGIGAALHAARSL